MTTTKARQTEAVADMGDRDLVIVLCWHGAKLHNLTERQCGRIYQVVWAYTDAYGPRGFIPPQGYDWSGIRDSSESARKEMADVAREILHTWGVTKLDYSI